MSETFHELRGDHLWFRDRVRRWTWIGLAAISIGVGLSLWLVPGRQQVIISLQFLAVLIATAITLRNLFFWRQVDDRQIADWVTALKVTPWVLGALICSWVSVGGFFVRSHEMVSPATGGLLSALWRAVLLAVLVIVVGWIVIQVNIKLPVRAQRRRLDAIAGRRSVAEDYLKARAALYEYLGFARTPEWRCDRATPPSFAEATALLSEYLAVRFFQDGSKPDLSAIEMAVTMLNGLAAVLGIIAALLEIAVYYGGVLP